MGGGHGAGDDGGRADLVRPSWRLRACRRLESDRGRAARTKQLGVLEALFAACEGAAIRRLLPSAVQGLIAKDVCELLLFWHLLCAAANIFYSKVGGRIPAPCLRCTGHPEFLKIMNLLKIFGGMIYEQGPLAILEFLTDRVKERTYECNYERDL